MKWRETSIKKKILIVIIAIITLIALLIGAVCILDAISDQGSAEGPIDYDFHPVDYTEDIFSDSEYIELIELGYLNFTENGLTYGIDREDAKNYGDDVEFMCSFVDKIINGEVDAYNLCFSKLYYKNNSPKESFTRQKLYDVYIVKDYEIKSENGDYTEYKFKLTYNIFKNNGTYRNDIGDGKKTQYIIVTDREGKLLIDSISTAKIIVQK